MKHFTSYMLTQQAYFNKVKVAKSNNIEKSASKYPSLLFSPVHFTTKNTDTFNIQKFSQYLEQCGHVME